MIKYTAKSEYVDADTGAYITRKNALTNYIIIKTKKTHQIKDYTNGSGYENRIIITTHTHICEKDKQIKLWKQQTNQHD